MAGFDIKRFLELAGEVKTDDLDWDACAKAGISPEEARILRYMADTESHTILYMRDLLAGHSTRDPAITAFLSVWVYEELCHGRALSKVLEVCGYPEDEDHYSKVTTGSSVRELVEAVISHGLAYLTPSFIGVHMTWGAINEAAAAVAYQRLEKQTQNPVLATLCNRLARQERRHFSFYYHQAKKRLETDRVAQFLTHTAIKRFWTLWARELPAMIIWRLSPPTYFPMKTPSPNSIKLSDPFGNYPGWGGFVGSQKKTRVKAQQWRAMHGQPSSVLTPPNSKRVLGVGCPMSRQDVPIGLKRWFVFISWPIGSLRCRSLSRQFGS